MKLTTPQFKTLATAIYRFFHSQDTPPADEIYVPLDNIKQGDNEDSCIATVRFVTNYCSRRVHSVRIKFNIDQKGRFIPKSYRYI